MNNLFYNCSKLSSLPDIYKWNTNNITDMNNLFYNCSSLSSLPDISNWNIFKLTNKINMFEKCNKNLIISDKFKC